MTYTLKNDHLTISRRVLFSKKEEVLYSGQIKQALLEPLIHFNSDTLNTFYYNYCVVSTSGNEYFITLTKGTLEKRISLHHYYHAQVEALIKLLNLCIPEEYSIHYLGRDTKQNCK